MAASSNVRSLEERMLEAVLLQAKLQLALENNKRLEEKLKRKELEAGLEAKRKSKKSGWKVAWKIAKFILKLGNEECKFFGDKLDKGVGDMINLNTWKDVHKMDELFFDLSGGLWAI